MEEPELLPCPTCKTPVDDYLGCCCNYGYRNGDIRFFVVCGNCVEQTPDFPTALEAILYWNELPRT